MKPAYFVAYLTANESSTFHFDYFNLLNMLKHDPGVRHIHLYLAISIVKKMTGYQRKIFGAILQAANKCRWMTCEAVILKSNTGRDFSSLLQCLMELRGKANSDDFILVRNRSSRGPVHATMI